MTKTTRIIAVASAGGHWVQLMRLREAWKGLEVTYVTTDAGMRPVLEDMARAAGEPPPRLRIVEDGNRWQKTRLLKQLLQLTAIVLTERPDAIITTGAAPGYFALRLGRMIGARTIWVDSIANAEKLSLSGQKIGRYADLWLTQWPHLAREDGPRYLGSVL